MKMPTFHLHLLAAATCVLARLSGCIPARRGNSTRAWTRRSDFVTVIHSLVGSMTSQGFCGISVILVGSQFPEATGLTDAADSYFCSLKMLLLRPL